MVKEILAFADEYGSNSFDFGKEGTHFIVVSIITNGKDLPILEGELEAVRKKYFQTGEIKSSKVGDDHQRRLIILQELVKSNFSIYALVTDKEKLYGEGFKYKASFYKYLNGILYKELYKAYPSLRLAVDEHGGNEFLKSFKHYIEANHVSDLFSGSEFQTMNSGSSILIQLADFIAGTLARCYDRKRDLSFKEEFLTTLHSRLISINHFPKSYHAYEAPPTDVDGEHDVLISQYATRLAIDFIERKSPKNQEEIDQINCLKLLMMHRDVFGAKKYLSAKELMNHLLVGREKPLNEQQFRSTVIGKLRDQGLLIASSSRGEKKGYRLPTSAADLFRFLEHGNNQILPMLHRIKICREQVKLATNNSLDILDNTAFFKLKDILAV